ncbi:MAG: hypothetical protein Unbinned96contig1001_26 [Prokaryotic dsDNA virus sp.]|nr:MAG: hypothetical protein Unbinned96contig1001_26 [Prokaryotic dsDNA virus sp.]|tara:strand:- start:15013 stop:15222 length:210 start_codon:yes stop_codon:yes gene_type:complete
MSYEITLSQNLKQSQYERMKSDSSTIQNQVTAWRQGYVNLRASSTTEEQVDLDLIKNELVAALNAALGN